MISISKITNTNATKKKCKEKDIRNSFKVKNPHSNGLWYSRSKSVFFLKNFPNIKSNKAKTKTENIKIINISIVP